MKIKILFIIIIEVLINIGCSSRMYVYIQNKTDNSIQIYKTDIFDYKIDSVSKFITQKNHLDIFNKESKFTMHYHKILNPDSLAFLDIVYGKKSKTELVDINNNYFNSQLIIVLNTDTIFFNKEKMIQKINEAWKKRNTNLSIKVKPYDKYRLVWEFRNDSLIK